MSEYPAPALNKTHNDLMIDAIMAAFKVPAHIEQAFRKTPRHYFLPGVDLDAAYKEDAVVTSWT